MRYPDPRSRPPPRGAGRARAWKRSRRSLAGLPLDAALACAGGVAAGAVAATLAYVSYLHAGGPTGAGVAAMPVSFLIVAAAYGLLARRRRRAGDWLGLGYTVAVVLATGLLILWEVLRGFYAELGFAAW